MTLSSPERFALSTSLLRDGREIIDERPLSGPPGWVAARGWAGFLDDLSLEQLSWLEREGLAQHADSLPGLPADLRDLAAQTRLVCAFPPPAVADYLSVSGQRASPRKRSQVASFVALLRPLAASARRVVDVGSGHGHLTRHLAQQLEVPVEGWELDAARIAVATELPGAKETTFRGVDASAAVSELGPEDLVIGLHACGELADAAVRAAASAGAAVAIVGCCLQKRRGERVSLSTDDPRDSLSREVLGLGNVVLGVHGVEEPLAVRLRSRENRIALRLLLIDAGIPTTPGEEMRGQNRRRAVGSLSELARAAFALRNLAPPAAAQVRSAGEQARLLHGSLRRWDLPRAMLGRVIEVWVAEDRAACLARGAPSARVELAFDAAESPRNLTVLAPRAG